MPTTLSNNLLEAIRCVGRWQNGLSSQANPYYTDVRSTPLLVICRV
jgi:hypothetical protein